MDTTQALRELLTRWDEYRAKWIAAYGNDDGFSAWFSKQVIHDVQGKIEEAQ